jgi:hypothetical protein
MVNKTNFNQFVNPTFILSFPHFKMANLSSKILLTPFKINLKK